MASDPITSWQIDGETMETVKDFIFLRSKILADGDCSHETKRRMFLGRKAMTNIDSILKTETLLYQQSSVYSNYGFSSSHVWMWELDHKERWAPKNWCFELWYWRRLLRVPWIARRYNQSILKEISPEYSLEGLMLKLKLQYVGHLMRRTDSLEKTLMLRKTDGRRRRGWQDETVGWHHLRNGQEFEQALGVGGGQGRPVCCSPWGRKQLDMTEQLNWLMKAGKIA